MRMPADHWFRESFIQGKSHVPGLSSGPEVVTLRRGRRRSYLVTVVPPTVFPDTAAARGVVPGFHVAVDDFVLDDGDRAGVAAGMVSFWTWRPC